MLRNLYIAFAFLFLPSFITMAADIPESSRSKAAIAKYEGRLEIALNEAKLNLGDPIFLRIIKTQSFENKQGQLEAYVKNADGVFVLFKIWDICYYSGELGPKLKQGDGQSPEGFYFVKPAQMNPYSSYHLSFNLGYPNAYDRAHRRTGDYLMVHGDCVSIGCYAMTDDGIEEIYTLMNAALIGGQPFIRTHIFPFPMTDENMKVHQANENYAFWENLKMGWDWFEDKSQPPNVNVTNKSYVFSSSE